MEDPILKPIGEFPDLPHSLSLNKIKILSKQHHNRVIISSLNKYVIHLHIVIVVDKSGIPQLIVYRKYLGIVGLMNGLFIVVVVEYCFEDLEVLLVHLALVEGFGVTGF